jgi:hypothetical protein
MVEVVAQAGFARVLLVVMVPWAGIAGVAFLPLVLSCGGDGISNVQETDVEDLSMEMLFVEQPSCFWRVLARSSGELKPRLHW